LATNTTGSAGLSAELRTWYDKNLLARLLPRLVYMNFGQVRPMPAHEGQTVNFRRFDALAVATTALTEGVTPGNETPTISQVTATPAQYGSWVEISDILDFTAPDPILTEFTQLLAEQAAQSMDILTRDVLVAGTNVQYADAVAGRSSVAATTGILDVAEMRKAVRTMQSNKVAKLTGILNASTGVGTKPINGAYIGIIGPYALYDLKADSNFISVEEYGSSAGGTLPFEVGSLDDVRFVLTNHPKVYTGAGAAGIDVHATLVIGADAFGMISPMGIENIIKGFGVNGNDPLNQRATTGWKAYYTAVILQQLAILRIEHAVSA
jgi:N4-gp56 family major capsid protein